MGLDVLPRFDAETTGDLTIDLYSDVHVGSRAFDKALFEKHLAETLATPDRICVFLGDLLQADLKSGKHAGVYTATMTNDEALDYLDEQLTPLTDKIAGFVIGNHDLRIYDATGIDPMKQLCSRLRLADRYAPFGAVLQTRHGKSLYSLNSRGKERPLDYFGYLNHGTGNSTTTASIERVGATIEGLDWSASGHTHAPHASADRVFSIDRQHGTVSNRDRRFVVTGSYQDYDDYAKDRRMKARPLGRVQIVLSGDERKVTVKL